MIARVVLFVLTALSLPLVAAEPTHCRSLEWSQGEREIGFRNYGERCGARDVDAGSSSWPLLPAFEDPSTISYEIDGAAYSLDDFFEHNEIAGFMVVKGDRVLLERYRMGHDAKTRWISYSIAKSVTSMLIGAAIRDGYILNVDEPVTDYLPRLRGTPYDGVTIRQVLQMASGVEWNEDYADLTSDVAYAGAANGLPLVAYLSTKPRVAPPGEKFNYNTGETNLVGELLRSATGNNASAYLEAKIWRPVMADRATWSLTENVETGGCCIHATLGDYARLGLFAMRGGVLPDGTEVLADDWMADSITPSQAMAGYGYLWWLWGGGAYSAIGISGQLIYIDPTSELVIVTHSAWTAAGGRAFSQHRAGMIGAVREWAAAF